MLSQDLDSLEETVLTHQWYCKSYHVDFIVSKYIILCSSHLRYPWFYVMKFGCVSNYSAAIVKWYWLEYYDFIGYPDW